MFLQVPLPHGCRSHSSISENKVREGVAVGRGRLLCVLAGPGPGRAAHPCTCSGRLWP